MGFDGAEVRREEAFDLVADPCRQSFSTTTERDIGQMFVIGNAKVIPNLSGVYQDGQEVGVYLQVYNAGIDQTTLRPAVDVDYVLTKDGKEVLSPARGLERPQRFGPASDPGPPAPDRPDALGDYEIKILTKDRVSGQVIENKGKFTVTQ